MIDQETPQNTMDEPITRGTDNVFADRGFADAVEHQTKLRLALAINSLLTREGLTQVKAAERLGVNQPKVSALAAYKLSGFSVERLMTFLTALDQDVSITIRKKPRHQARGKITVKAAIAPLRHHAHRPDPNRDRAHAGYAGIGVKIAVDGG